MSSWQGSNRRDRLPPGWDKLRKQILKRDHGECQERVEGDICGRPANEVDHVRPGDDHRPSNLRAICSWHHGKKSSAEGNAEKHRRRREIASRFDRTEEHPGLL